MRRVDIDVYEPAKCDFDGKVIKTITSKDFFIISCADCKTPRVEFRDRFELSLAKEYPYSGPFGTAPINLAVLDNDDFDSLSVFIGANNNIDQVEYFKRKDEKTFFNFLNNVFDIPVTHRFKEEDQKKESKRIVDNPEITVSASNNYVAFKLSWDDAIYTMASC